jgi:hypothetical protein
MSDETTTVGPQGLANEALAVLLQQLGCNHGQTLRITERQRQELAAAYPDGYGLLVFVAADGALHAGITLDVAHAQILQIERTLRPEGPGRFKGKGF